MKILGMLKSVQKRRNAKKGMDRIEAAVACAIESLEQRMMLTGSWTSLVHQPANASTMLLLSDGTVMVQGGDESATWNRLTPDASGSYVNGTFSALASSHVGRLYYASAVLPDGRVFVAGGEYATDGGETRSGEIYNPQTNTWTTIATFPLTYLGDSMSEALADAPILAQITVGPATYSYAPR